LKSRGKLVAVASPTIPETANRKDWPRLVKAAFDSLVKRMGGVETNVAGLQTALGGKESATAWAMLTADYTLTSTTAVQKLFNTTTNGALTLETGVYEFRAFYYLDAMSATSGNAAYSLAGTAVTDRWGQFVAGLDSTTPLAAGARNGTAAVTSATPASATVAATGTGQVVQISGMFRVSTAGTIIPSVALVTAAAAIVKAGSWFAVTKVGTSAQASAGAWS
jgi:hypothetical protein